MMSQIESSPLKEDKSSISKQDCAESYRLECKKYGFDCSFVTSGKIETVIRDFGEHVLCNHHIEYPQGVLMKFISRKH